jgi:hypothetical protein
MRLPSFSSDVIEAIADSLPEPRSEGCRKLLPQILDEWSRNELQRHVRHFSKESRSVARERMKKLEIVRKRAGELLEALEAVDENARTGILAHLMIIAEGRRPEDVSRAEYAVRIRRLDEERDFLARLAAVAPTEFGKRESGQPRNLHAYLVLQDAAAIFEWFSGMKAARGVDRTSGTETGPFFRFASTLWPLVFGKNRGLPAAMKNWALWRSQYDERSALITNIGLRHPTWGIFEC